MAERFTPGPWEVPDQTWRRNLTVNTSGGMDATMIQCAGSGGAMSYTDEICTMSWKDDGEWLANAHLIAAAPDLYEALKWYKEQAAWVNNFGPKGEAARNAIANDQGQRAITALSKAHPTQGDE